MTTIYDCYQMLHIQPDCSDLQVRKAYRKLAKLLHPDKNNPQVGVSQQFCHLNEAYKKIISFRKKYPNLNEPVKKQFSRQFEIHQQSFIQYEEVFRKHLHVLNIARKMLKQISTKYQNNMDNQQLLKQ